MDESGLQQRIQQLERENRLLKEQARQGERLRDLWQKAVLQLQEARRALIASQRELQQSYQTLERQVEELRIANETIERLAYNDKQVIENLREAVLVTNAQGEIINVNPAFVRTTGFAREEVLGKNPRLLKSGIQDAAFYAKLWGQLLAEGRWQGEVWNRRKSGELYATLLSISAIRNWRGETVNFVGISMDISELKRVQAELERARERAETADRAKSAFLANVSHELRTPLNAISGHAQGLARGSLDPAQRRAVDGILRGGDRLLALIEDVLALTKAEAGSFDLHPAPCDLGVLLHNLEVWFAPQAKAKGLALEFIGLEGLPPVIEADAKRLRQVLANLLDNAIKFTTDGGIRLETRVGGDTGALLEITVADSGIGIEPERLPGLLLPQFGGALSADVPETRLGLAVVQGITARMGGTLHAVSRPGFGSRFTLTLPLVVPATSEPPPPQTVPAQLSAPLPAEERETLLALVGRGRIGEVQQQLRRLLATNPDHPRLLPLNDAASRFDLPRIRRLLDLETGADDAPTATRQKVKPCD